MLQKMNAQELLINLTQKRADALFYAVRQFPADKLDWKPTESSRSALDMLQEIATALDRFEELYNKRTLEWNPDAYMAWVAERSQITSLDELQKMTQESTDRLAARIRATDPSEYTAPVQMPFPGDFNVADILAYHLWNMSYHEGQIYYIQTLIEGGMA